jgi:molecular chaperone GrpE
MSKKVDLEKLAFEHSNDFELGGKVREIVNENATSEDVQEAQTINWEEKYLSLAAEFDNFRKRVSKEKEELVIKTKTSMIEPILQVDNDIAIATKHSTDPGIKLIVSKLETFLQSQGIQTVQTQTYDENIHEVINVVELEQKGIIDVVCKGYSIGDKIIRYPKIVLSK